MRDNSRDPTRWAVICRVHGLQFLSHDQYLEQLDRPDDRWECPVCGAIADWDDECQETNP